MKNHSARSRIYLMKTAAKENVEFANSKMGGFVQMLVGMETEQATEIVCESSIDLVYEEEKRQLLMTVTRIATAILMVTIQSKETRTETEILIVIAKLIAPQTDFEISMVSFFVKSSQIAYTVQHRCHYLHCQRLFCSTILLLGCYRDAPPQYSRFYESVIAAS